MASNPAFLMDRLGPELEPENLLGQLNLVQSINQFMLQWVVIVEDGPKANEAPKI